MEIIEAIKARKSIRGYKPDSVPRDVIEKVLGTAVRAPSGMNTQPWEFWVATGTALDNIRNENERLFTAGTMPDAEMLHKPFTGIYRERQVELAKRIFELMDIPREDRGKRTDWMKRGFRYFDAPVAIAVGCEGDMYEHVDLLGIGALCQTLCLAALEFGLGTCIADQGIMYGEVWRSMAGVPADKHLAAGIAMGYPDWDFPANRLVTAREPYARVTHWMGFD